ncbi:hypothetical protein GCM10010365_31780 [Streptomyces poonensis]|uniref:Uncharacterized protein n=1 Tax=Streptomyces poonensis TaxID=68255 RepID=A0A918UGW6_9ACTN|nr:hypothetical protein GCM10010365_31780 [Streptomyces poonensis]GLJ91341.1 hypothetical protein GCM10017589_39480 [Streptomyces poonensis]
MTSVLGSRFQSQFTPEPAAPFQPSWKFQKSTKTRARTNTSDLPFSPWGFLRGSSA